VTGALAAALAEQLGAAVAQLLPVAGGDVSQAFRAQLADGRAVFVKTRAEHVPGMYAREAEGLSWLDEASALRLPKVLAVDERWLALEWIASGPRSAQYDQALGRGLGRLHAFGARRFGLTQDNLIASLHQDNRACDDWSEFYGQRRLLPLAAEARKRGALQAALEARIAKLCTRLPSLCGERETPARLHGDLWSGNVMVDERGDPVLVDPAVYAGDREIDLAMLQLFGAPSARFFAAYDEVYPRKAGADERVALYQLYPLLVHVCLFGASYVKMLTQALSRYE
jgi:fructosamine-3-kinase